jgi:hypothetical protein
VAAKPPYLCVINAKKDKILRKHPLWQRGPNQGIVGFPGICPSANLSRSSSIAEAAAQQKKQHSRGNRGSRGSRGSSTAEAAAHQR